MRSAQELVAHIEGVYERCLQDPSEYASHPACLEGVLLTYHYFYTATVLHSMHSQHASYSNCLESLLRTNRSLYAAMALESTYCDGGYTAFLDHNYGERRPRMGFVRDRMKSGERNVAALTEAMCTCWKSFLNSEFYIRGYPMDTPLPGLLQDTEQVHVWCLEGGRPWHYGYPPLALEEEWIATEEVREFLYLPRDSNIRPREPYTAFLASKGYGKRVVQGVPDDVDYVIDRIDDEDPNWRAFCDTWREFMQSSYRVQATA